MHALALRCTFLLVQNEVTADLSLAEKTRASARERQHAAERRMRSIDDEPIHHHHQQQQDDGDAGGAGGSVSPPNDGSNAASTSSPWRYQTYWTPSFWTRHRYMVRGTRLRLIITLLISSYLLVDIGTAHLITSVTDACEASQHLLLFRRVALQCHAVLAFPSAILLTVVAWHLRRHAADAYGNGL